MAFESFGVTNPSSFYSLRWKFSSHPWTIAVQPDEVTGFADQCARAGMREDNSSACVRETVSRKRITSFEMALPAVHPAARPPGKSNSRTGDSSALKLLMPTVRPVYDKPRIRNQPEFPEALTVQVFLVTITKRECQAVQIMDPNYSEPECARVPGVKRARFCQAGVVMTTRLELAEIPSGKRTVHARSLSST